MSEAAIQWLVDRDEIRDVILRYAQCVDRRDFSTLESCFTPDVEGDFGGEWRSGRDGLIEFISGVVYFHTTMHLMANGFVSIAGDQATLQSYAALTHHGTNDDGEEWQYNNSTARYSEALVRTPEGWRIRERGVQTEWGVTEPPYESSDPAVRWLLDRAQIHEIAMQYALGIDQHEYDRVRGCFAEDFSAHYGDRVFTDLDSLVAFIRGVETFESTSHFLGTPLIEVAGDQARVETVAYIVHRETREGKRPRERMGGGVRYVDRWVRVGSSWRIAERTLGREPNGTLTPPQPAPQSEDPTVQQLIDRAEIADLVTRSGLALDREEDEVARACFSGAGAAFVDQERARCHGWERCSRMLGNQRVSFEEGGASAETYHYRTHHEAADDPASPWSEGAFRWVDALVREPAGWRIAHRESARNRVRPAVG
jgi:hypothetical protein